MKRNVIVTAALVFLIPAMALAINTDRFEVSKAVMADNELEREVIVPISVDNTEDLVALDIPLSYSEGAVLKKVEFTDRVKNFDMQIARIEQEKNRVLIGLISISFKDRPDMTAGTGPIANLHFVLEEGMDVVEVKPIYIEKPNHFLAYYYNDWSTGKPILKQIDPDVSAAPVNVRDDAMKPDQYDLLQNSPNPFNPTTTIKFATAQPGHVNLTVFNVLGQQVRTLVDEYKDADVHEVVWDSKDNNGASVASGIYFYRIKTDNFSKTKKMVLLK